MRLITRDPPLPPLESFSVNYFTNFRYDSITLRETLIVLIVDINLKKFGYNRKIQITFEFSVKTSLRKSRKGLTACVRMELNLARRDTRL